DDSRDGLAPFRNGLGGPLVQPISRAPGEGGGLERGASSSSFVDDPEDQGLLVAFDNGVLVQSFQPETGHRVDEEPSSRTKMDRKPREGGLPLVESLEMIERVGDAQDRIEPSRLPQVEARDVPLSPDDRAGRALAPR